MHESWPHLLAGALVSMPVILAQGIGTQVTLYQHGSASGESAVMTWGSNEQQSVCKPVPSSMDNLCSSMKGPNDGWICSLFNDHDCKVPLAEANNQIEGTGIMNMAPENDNKLSSISCTPD